MFSGITGAFSGSSSPKREDGGPPKMAKGGKLVNSTDFDMSIFELVSEIFPTSVYYRVFLETRNDGETNVKISDWAETPADMYIEGEETKTYTRQVGYDLKEAISLCGWSMLGQRVVHYKALILLYHLSCSQSHPITQLSH